MKMEKRWCGNCEFVNMKEEKEIQKVTLKCTFVIPMWVKLGWSIGDEPDEDELREFSFYKDLSPNCNYGSDCLCHKLKGEAK